MTQRTDRLDELLRQEIGTMLEREVADPRIGFATVTKVETTPDMRHAKVWVSIIGPDAKRPEALTALEHSMVFIRRELGTRLRLKRIPNLHVRLDETIERGTRILTLIDAIETGVDPGAAPTDESLPTPTRGVPAGETDAPAAIAAVGADAAGLDVGGTARDVIPTRPARPSDEGFGGAAADYAAALEAELSARRRPSRGTARAGSAAAGRPRRPRG
jgi:ribosome-binding factor A